MTKKTRKILLAWVVLLLVILSSGLLSAQDEDSFQVIVHQDNPTDSMTRAEVSRLLLKKMSRWSFGDKPPAHPVDQAQGTSIRDDFSQVIHKRSSSAVRSYWQQRIFSGRGVPPPEASSDEEVVEFVKDDLGGIGYVARGTSLDGVKSIEITD